MLDGEPAGMRPAELEEHLSSCAECERWREGAHEVTRRIRLAAAKDVPVPGPALRDAARASARARRLDQVLAARIGLVAVAVAQLAWVTVPALLLGHDRGAPVHVAHEMGAFDVALAVGFIVAAARPQRAQGMRALVGTVALALVATAIVDILSVRTTAADEAPHLLAVAGWLLLRRIATLDPDRDRGREAAVAWPALPALHRAARAFGSRARASGRTGSAQVRIGGDALRAPGEHAWPADGFDARTPLDRDDGDRGRAASA